ncbi:helix-turn-helix domain-containing protein [Nocardia aurea]|uniref:helix-turn-helix domain-containing protein n=1 Tax=Nocardia aurea TaxID=2144174 RepID=UPI0033B87BEA
MDRDIKGSRGKGPDSTPFAEADWERVGETLRTLREMRGMRTRELAQAAGISISYLGNIEHGRKKLTNRVLALIAKELGVSQIAIMRPALEQEVSAS